MIGLTGGIACGKSEVAAILRGKGVPVLDTDAVAHALLQPGQAVFDAVIAAFGKMYLTDEGTVNRKALGTLVFGDDDARKKLNGLMHPEIYRQSAAWVIEQRATHPWVVVMIPLLFENGADHRFEKIVVVAADEAVMLKRMAARGWTEEASQARMRAQWPVAEKVRRADAVIWNNGDLEALNEATWKAWRMITGTAPV